MADEAKPDPKPSATLWGFPVGDLIDLIKNFTLNMIAVGVIVGGFYFALTQPDKWLNRFNEGRNEQQKNYLDADLEKSKALAAVEKERETIRATSLKSFADAVEKMSISQEKLSTAINDMAKHVMGRTYTTPKKSPDKAGDASKAKDDENVQLDGWMLFPVKNERTNEQG